MSSAFRFGLTLCLLGAFGAGTREAEAQTLTLTEALAAALEHHPSVRGATAGLDGADAAQRVARAARIPSVAASGSMVRFQEPMIIAPLHGLDLSVPPEFDRTLIQSQVGLSYTLFDGGARGARIDGADAGSGVAAARLVDTEMALLEGVVGSYLAVLTTDAVLEAAERRVASLTSERDRARRFVQEGSAPRLQLLRAEAALTDAQATRISAQSRSALARRGLARLTGLDTARVSQASLVSVAPPAGVPAGAMADNPVVTQARGSVEGARAALSEVRASRLPTLSATAAVLDFGSAAGDFVAEWQAGVRVSWPVFTGGARSARIARAEADLRAAEERLRLAELEVDGAADQARSQLEEALGRSEALAAAVRQWEEVVRIERLSLQEGAGTQSDFLQAEAGLFQARAGLAESTHQATLARVRLERALGQLNRIWIAESLENGR